MKNLYWLLANQLKCAQLIQRCCRYLNKNNCLAYYLVGQCDSLLLLSCSMALQRANAHSVIVFDIFRAPSDWGRQLSHPVYEDRWQSNCQVHLLTYLTSQQTNIFCMNPLSSFCWAVCTAPLTSLNWLLRYVTLLLQSPNFSDVGSNSVVDVMKLFLEEI